jgi:hydroxyethylthiazole kinase-like uncharacterized protein yjeF
MKTAEHNGNHAMNDPYSHVLLTPAEMGQADRAAVAAGVSDLALMEAAGWAVAQAVRTHWSRRRVAVLCGPGNNGGDGFVAARFLAARGWRVRLGLLGDKGRLTGSAAHNAARWRGPIEPVTPELLDRAEVVVDAMFGAGLSRPIEGAAHTMIEAMISRKIPVCAVDVPSGLDGATGAVLGAAAPADVTVTFFRKKPGHLLLPGRELCGKIVLADIGIPPAVLQPIAPLTFENAPALWLDAYPWPKTAGHKYQRGHALILGGKVMTGASRLAALGAMRIGAGLVTLAAPENAWPVYAASMMSVIVQPIAGVAEFEALLADPRRNAIAIGPGAGVGEDTRQGVIAALATKRAVILDADALTSFADCREALFGAIAGPCVLTPHEGEFARLFPGGCDKLARARDAAKRSNAVIALKGADTVIATPDGRAIINTNAPPELATGGSGDVLTGFITGLMAQGLDPFRAAAAAVWLHGEAAAEFGAGLMAGDLPDTLLPVLQRLKRPDANRLGSYFAPRRN